jgi:hypothetical protein
MIAIVEAYDAMTSTRPYRQGLSRKTAVETLVASSGTQFDGALVDTFVTTLRRPMLGTSSSPVLSTIETQFRELFVGLRRVGAVALSATASTIAIALILGSGALSPGTPTTPAVAAPQRHSSLADDEVLGTRVDLPSAPGDTGAETGGGADDIGGVSQTPDTTDQTLTSDGVTFTASIDEAIADDLGSDPGGTDPGTEPGPGTGGSEGGGPSQPPPDAGGGSEQPPPPDSGQPPPDSGGGSAEQPPDGGSGPEQPPPSDPKDKNPDANGNGHAYGHDKKDDGSTGP